MTRLFSDRAAAARAQRRLAALAEGADRQRRRVRSGCEQHGDDCSTSSSSTSPTRPTSRSASSTPTPSTRCSTSAGGQRLCGGADHLAADRAQELLDRGGDARSRRACTATPYHAHVPSFGEWGFVLASRRPYRPPATLPPGLRFLTCTALPRAVRLPARHGARAGRSEPAVEPGAGADLRARSGARCSVSRQGAHAGASARRRAARGAGHAGGLRSTRRRSARRPRRASALDARPPAARRRRRARAPAPAVAAARRVLVVGGGIAGLAAARALRLAGIDDFALLELEDAAGRQQPRPRACGGMRLPARRALPAGAGRRCARGERPARRARPAPQRARPLRSTTSATCATARRSGSSSTAAGRRACCRRSGAAAARRDARAVPRVLAARRRELRRDGRFAIPTRARALDARPCRARRASRSPRWLDREGLDAPRCAGTSTTAAATTTAPARRRSRPGPACTTSPAGTASMRPGDDNAERDAVLTWPEGNAWLAGGSPRRSATGCTPAGRCCASRRPRRRRGRRLRLRRRDR